MGSSLGSTSFFGALFGHLIETLHTVWDQTKGHRGGLDNMSDAHEAGEAAS